MPAGDSFALKISEELKNPSDQREVWTVNLLNKMQVPKLGLEFKYLDSSLITFHHSQAYRKVLVKLAKQVMGQTGKESSTCSRRYQPG